MTPSLEDDDGVDEAKTVSSPSMMMSDGIERRRRARLGGSDAIDDQMIFHVMRLSATFGQAIDIGASPFK